MRRSHPPRSLVAGLAAVAATVAATAPSAPARAADRPARLVLDGSDWTIKEFIPNRWNSSRFLYTSLGRGTDPRGWLGGGGKGRGWFPATVPGNVVVDLVKAKVIADPYREINSLAAEWVPQRDWAYVRAFDVPADWKGARVHLHAEGVDPGGVFFVNGKEVGTHTVNDGPFQVFEVDVTDAIKFGEQNHLDVIVFHAPDLQPEAQKENHIPIWKAKFANGWDFAPRLHPTGLWDSVWLDATGPARLGIVNVAATVEKNGRGRAEVKFAVSGDARAARSAELEITLDGKPVARQTVAAADGAFKPAVFTVDKPALWFPNGAGAQPIYKLVVAVKDAAGAVSDRRETTFGFRKIEWVRAAGAPKDAIPYSPIVNGKRVFLKGWNWVPLDQMYGTATFARYERFMRLMKDSGANLVRVWGGGLIEKQAFYDLADRHGIMIWQEVPQSSQGGRENLPGSDPAYLAFVGKQMRGFVPRRSNHPSLVIWCGGNELIYDDWRAMGYEHPMVQKMKEVLDELDPDTLLLPTSPTGGEYFSDPKHKGKMHDAHGPWHYQGVEKHYTHYNVIDPMFHTEYGTEGATNLAALRTIADDAKLVPFDNEIWRHHGGTWNNLKLIENLFGPQPKLEKFVGYSQFTQAEGLRYGLEAHRRRWPRAIGAMPWQLNEPWPNATCTNSVDYYGEPKPAFWWAKVAYAPRSLSAEYPRISWKAGDEFTADLFVINEDKPVAGARVVARLLDARGKELGKWESKPAAFPAKQDAVKVVPVRWKIPAGGPEVLFLLAEWRDGVGRVLADHRSIHAVSDKATLEPIARVEKTRLKWFFRPGDLLEIENQGPALALGVQVDAPGAYLDDNYRFLAPGETFRVTVKGAKQDAVKVTWWNQ